MTHFILLNHILQLCLLFPSQIGLLLTIVEFFIYELHFYLLTY